MRNVAPSSHSATEPIHVDPMRSDFHFFVDDMKESMRALAEKELSEKDRMDDYLVLSNTNSRILAAWEGLSPASRNSYFKKEEDDKVRFMMEDDIASRHCATLTARARSPRPGANKQANLVSSGGITVMKGHAMNQSHHQHRDVDDMNDGDDDDAEDDHNMGTRMNEATDIKQEEDGENRTVNEPKKTDTSGTKRMPPASSNNTGADGTAVTATNESPPKRGRTAGSSGDPAGDDGKRDNPPGQE